MRGSRVKRLQNREERITRRGRSVSVSSVPEDDFVKRPHTNERAIARRKRQIAAGTLRVS